MLRRKEDKHVSSLLNDISKFFTILIVINVFAYLSNPTKYTLLGENYLLFMAYFALGLAVYWLVVVKYIAFD